MKSLFCTLLKTVSILFFLTLSPNLLSTDLTETDWVESTLAAMTLQQKVAQLFVVDMRPLMNEQEYERISKVFHVDVLAKTGEDYEALVEDLIKNQSIGGVIFMRGTVEQQITLVNKFQAKSTIPLLIVQDAEWGPAMRLPELLAFPYNMTLGAIPENHHDLITKTGHLTALQLKALGVHMNYAPVVDVNTNRNNPIINHRSFGENKKRVALAGAAYLEGLHQARILGCAKHFPGHGDAALDSHKELPVLTQTRQQLEVTELYPFEYLIIKGIDGIMTAHLSVPNLDSTEHLSATMSQPILSLLRNNLDFQGLIFSDAMMMKSITDHFSPAQAALAGLKAGLDVIVMSPDPKEAIQEVYRAAEQDTSLAKLIDDRVYRMLKIKEKVGLHKSHKPLPLIQSKDLYQQEARQLKQELFDHAVTRVCNTNQILPLTSTTSTALVQLGISNPEQKTAFADDLTKQISSPSFSLAWSASQEEQNNLLSNLKSYQTLIISLHNMEQQPSTSFGITTQALDFLDTLCDTGKKTVIVVFGNPYSLALLKKKHDAIIMGYQDEPEAHHASARIIVGDLVPVGTLPVSADERYTEGMSS